MTCIVSCPDTIKIGTSRTFPTGRPRRFNPVKALVKNNYTEEALVVRTCVAQAMELVDENGLFDGEKVIATIEEVAAGTPQEENIELGLENCSTDGFADFETHEFIKCVLTYCATGEAP